MLMKVTDWISKAANYFKALSEQLVQKTYVPTLIKDIESWKQTHIQSYSFLSLFSRGKRSTNGRGYYNYIQWLNYTGKLD